MKKKETAHSHLTARLVADVLARRLPVAASFVLLLDTIGSLCEECDNAIAEAAERHARSLPSVARLARERQAEVEALQEETEKAFFLLESLPDLGARLAALDEGLVTPSLPLAEALVDHARTRARSTKRDFLCDLTTLAVAVAERLSRTTESKELLILARAQHANALRIGSRIQEAQEIVKGLLAVSDELLDPKIEAEVLWISASVKQHLGQLREALDLATRAGAGFAMLGESHETGRVLLTCAACAFELGSVRGAIESVRLALEQLDPDDRYATFCAEFKLALYLEEAGDLEEADEIASRLDPATAGCADPRLAAHVDWLGARLAAARGVATTADARYRLAVEGLVSHGNAIDAALAILELAQFLFVQGRAAEIESLCLAAASRVDAAGLTEKSRDVWQVFLVTARARSLQLRELLGLVEIVRRLRRKPESEVPRPS